MPTDNIITKYKRLLDNQFHSLSLSEMQYHMQAEVTDVKGNLRVNINTPHNILYSSNIYIYVISYWG